MLFLIEYDRPQGKLLTLHTFDDSQRKVAEDARLDLELRLNRQGVDHEVVLLGAESEEALRRGYRHYFLDLRTLLKSAADSIKANGNT